MELAQQRVLLTGAGGGIGRALATELAAAGARLAVVGRRPQPLEELAAALPDAVVATVPADLSAPDQCPHAVDTAKTALGGIDILINNAGAMVFGCFEDSEPASLEAIVRVNVLAPQLLTAAVLPEMLARGSGRVVNIGSGFGTVGYPFHVAYSASKFALRGFSESLRRELDGTGVGVVHIAPRATRTAMYDTRIGEAAGMTADSPETVARVVIKALKRGNSQAALGLAEQFFGRLNGIWPRLVDCGLRKTTMALRPLAVANAKGGPS